MVTNGIHTNLFPACAGVILDRVDRLYVDKTFPRVCGGDPWITALFSAIEGFSPRVRG